MSKKTKQEVLTNLKVNNVQYDMLSTFNKHYLDTLNEETRYSISIDPNNLYNFNDTEKLFIRNYIDFRNIPLASKLTGISEEQGVELYKTHQIREEIDRLNISIYVRNFNQKMLSLDAIGGWISAVITDQVPEVDKITTKDKLPFAKMLVEIQELKKSTIDNPQIVDIDELNNAVKDLSVKSIKQLINASNENDGNIITEKDTLISQINKDDSLSAEDIIALKSMSSEELLQILEDLNGKTKKRR